MKRNRRFQPAQAGLAAKNAILIVEFARDIELEGKARLDTVIEACRLRLRPILMTSFAFILGVLPPSMASHNVSCFAPAHYLSGLK